MSTNKTIAFVGNVCNCTYWYVKHLREVDIDARLYINCKKRDHNKQLILPFAQDPREEDCELGTRLPSWIKPFYQYSLKDLIRVCRDLNQSCLNISFGRIAIVVQFCNSSFLCFAVGSDLRDSVLRNSFLSTLYRRVLKKSKMVLFDNIDAGTLYALDKLKIKRYEWVPDYISQDVLLKIAEKSSIKEGFLNKFSEKFIFFSPSRLDFNQKGTNVLIQGFANFVKSSKDFQKNTRLLIINWGKDNKKTKNLIKQQGIEKNITILPTMPRSNIFELMQICSGVFGYFKNEKFGVHHFPVCIEEALALNSIIISSIDILAFKKITGEEPLLYKAFSVNDVKNQLAFIFKNYDAIKTARRASGLYWIKKYHNKEFIRKKITKIIKDYVKI